MSKSIVRYFIFFIFTGALLLYFFTGRTPFGKDNSSFSVAPGEEITRIDLFQGDKKLSLEVSADTWLINKKDEARRSEVIFILRTLRELKIKSPVSGEIFENEIISKKIDPVKVNIYAKRKLVKSFYVYSTASNSYGNIMKIKPTSKPFIVYVPGFEENIGSHFTVNELFWKPFIVFNFLPSQIDRVKVEFPADTTSSYIINYNNKTFTLSDLRKDISGWDTLRLKRYLTYFTSIPFEKWALDLSENEKRAIESGTPLIRISLQRSKREEIILTVWDKWISGDGFKKRDSDRVWAKTNGRNEIFIMRYFDLDPILKKRSYFFTD